MLLWEVIIIIIVSSISLPFLTGKVQAPLVISVDLVQIGDKTNIPYAPKVSDGEKTDKKRADYMRQKVKNLEPFTCEVYNYKKW